MGNLKLGLQLGYWGAGPDPRMVDIAQEAEKLGYDAVFTAEAWGSDAVTPIAYVLARRWKRGKMVQKSEGQVSRDMMMKWVRQKGVVLRGGGRFPERPGLFLLGLHGQVRVSLHGAEQVGVDRLHQWSLDRIGILPALRRRNQ